MAEVWTKWEGEIISGAFPLRRLLSGSDHGGVFLTQDDAHGIAHAAIKIIPTDPAHTVAQLSQWRLASTLSHPHLTRLLEAGRCQFESRQFLYVVMEYAEQILAQILPRRALTPDEARDMLRPTLDALAFLHSKDLVHGALKPANFLVIDDRLKLASDAIHPAGESRATTLIPSRYDPPETSHGRFSAAGDMWALGITLMEALTQNPPSFPDARSEPAVLPAALPAPFVDIVRRCLTPDPAGRPTATDLERALEPLAQAAAPAMHRPVEREAAGRPSSRRWPSQRLFVSGVAGLLMILAALWAGSQLMRSQPHPEQAASGDSPGASAPVASPAPLPAALRSQGPAAPPAADASSPVLYKAIPDVPHASSSTIHGHINVVVRVVVDGSGNVVKERLERSGPSPYFARLAMAAAHRWKFAPAYNQEAREWLLRFEFTRGGTTGQAAPRHAG